MVSIPGGTFQMGEGDRRISTPHSVTVPAFKIGKYEVTFAQWDACVADGGCGGDLPFGIDDTSGNLPVINVSRDDAQAFIDWLNRETGGGYRLPTEAEWEYAARAGTTTRYFWGDELGHNRANCDSTICGDLWVYTAPVGSFPANAWGLHDMHGNVAEIVKDCWNYGYEGAPSDGSAWENGDCTKRVTRGGYWDTNYVGGITSTYRGPFVDTARFRAIGFRLAQD